MLNWIAISCLAAGFCLLTALSVIDLRTRRLPSRLTAGFAALGLAFHLATPEHFISLEAALLGGIAGFGFLYAIRYLANRFYGEEAVGLGDVRLMGAGGLWLGPQAVMLATAAGAAVAVLYGLAHAFYRHRQTGTVPALGRLRIPA